MMILLTNLKISYKIVKVRGLFVRKEKFNVDCVVTMGCTGLRCNWI